MFRMIEEAENRLFHDARTGSKDSKKIISVRQHCSVEISACSRAADLRQERALDYAVHVPTMTALKSAFMHLYSTSRITGSSRCARCFRDQIVNTRTVSQRAQ